ncbi:hypothetical protein ETAA8_53150 [Anatilimnocola aggregata]|uniref:Uncharacterized protein n=1 Tax=Anatilimnocola aggregata TaxID=2528021 RepID=A0A517YIZ4_9BACT|nr:hypothetical protein ETAA8_53150 [Anatilimnocola aggregata]
MKIAFSANLGLFHAGRSQPCAVVRFLKRQRLATRFSSLLGHTLAAQRQLVLTLLAFPFLSLHSRILS